jgi:hypothetical protein
MDKRGKGDPAPLSLVAETRAKQSHQAGLVARRGKVMKAEVRHLNWSVYGEGRGRVAIRHEADYDIVAIRSLAGQKLPAGLLRPALDAAVPGWQQRAAELHRSRQRPWRVDTRIGMSGCITYLLRVLKDLEFCDAPIVARLHITMSGRLDQLGPIWLGDLLPLLEEAEALGSLEAPEAPEGAVVKCVQPPKMEGFIYPSETEGC